MLPDDAFGEEDDPGNEAGGGGVGGDREKKKKEKKRTLPHLSDRRGGVNAASPGPCGEGPRGGGNARPPHGGNDGIISCLFCAAGVGGEGAGALLPALGPEDMVAWVDRVAQRDRGGRQWTASLRRGWRTSPGGGGPRRRRRRRR